MYVENETRRREYKKIYRSRNGVLGGVCAGIAEYFNVDVAVVRIAALISLLMGSLGFWAYVICWIAIPLRPLWNKDFDSQR